VVCIKAKVLILVLIISIAITLLTTIFTQNTRAEGNHAEIIFAEEPTYELVNVLTKNNKEIGWTYQINVTLKNIGDKKSDELVVNLSDDEGFSLLNYTIIKPGEIKNISFRWSTIQKRDHVLTIRYFPADLDKSWNKYNSGLKKLTIPYKPSNEIQGTSTPGFEAIATFISITIAILLMYSTRKKIYN